MPRNAAMTPNFCSPPAVHEHGNMHAAPTHLPLSCSAFGRARENVLHWVIAAQPPAWFPPSWTTPCVPAQRRICLVVVLLTHRYSSNSMDQMERVIAIDGRAVGCSSEQQHPRWMSFGSQVPCSSWCRPWLRPRSTQCSPAGPSQRPGWGQ